MPSPTASSDPKTRSEANSAYRGALSASVQEITALWERACGDQDPAALTVLHRLAHNLNGACSLMGFKDLGRAAREFEQRVAVLIPLRGRLGRADQCDLNRLMDALYQADPLCHIAPENREEV